MRFLAFLLVFLVSAARAEAPSRWTARYDTPWRSISVDAVPTVPSADAFPVLTVQPAYWFPTATGKVAWTGGLIHGEQGGDAFELYRESREFAVGSFRQVSVFHEAPMSLHAAYAPNSPLTLSDMLGCLDALMAEADSAPFGIDREHLDFLRVTSHYRQDGSLARPDSLTVNLFTTLRGVPLWGHVGTGRLYRRDGVPVYDTHLTFTMTSTEDYRLLGRTVRETGVAEENAPLCPFADVQRALEEEILAGHIRRIDHVDLGYALYNGQGVTLKPGKGRMKGVTMYAVPTWRCVCLYSEDAAKELPDGAFEEPQTSMYLRTLFVDARTGRLVDPLNGESDEEAYAPLP